MISFRGIISSGDNGRDKVRMARGITRKYLLGTSPMSGATPIESSMKISTFPLSFDGMLTDIDLACAKGMSGGSDEGLSSSSEIGSNNSFWFQWSFCSREFPTSVIVSEITPQSSGPGEPPKVKCKATSKKCPKIVILLKAVRSDRVQRL